MVNKVSINSGPQHLIALGAGLAAALLFTVARQGTLLALALAYLSPLPIMIATLGFGQKAGLLAALLGSFVAGLLAATPLLREGAHSNIIAMLITSVTFAISQGLPGWWLARLAGLGRSKAQKSWHFAPSDEERSKAPIDREYYPLGRILVYAAGVSFLLVAVIVVVVSLDDGGFEAAFDHAAKKCCRSFKA